MTFSFVFVHGFGGHAFKTFNQRKDADEAGCMWCRDLLPNELRQSGFFGRYSTFGYESKWTRGSEDKREIIELAEELLNGLNNIRPNV